MGYGASPRLDGCRGMNVQLGWKKMKRQMGKEA